MEPYEVLIIEDQPEIVNYCERYLGDDFRYEMIQSGREVDKLLTDKEFDLVLLDKNFSHLPAEHLVGPPHQVAQEGIAILKKIKQADPNLPVIMITSYGDAESVSAAFRLGAFDYIEAEILTKDEMILRRKMENAVAGFSARTHELVEKYNGAGLIGRSAAMIELFRKLEEALRSEATVLLLGEPGVGKDVVARALHALSSRSDKPFIMCDMTRSSLIESMLFGVAARSATGVDGRKGHFQQADGGLLFLNEIGELPLDMQSKLLTSLEDREFYPVGGTAKVTFDVRIVAATNRDLVREVGEGRFRSDLYSRLNQLKIHVPSIARRREDIAPLVRHFLNQGCAKNDIPPLEISDAALKHLEQRPWKFNVREIKHLAEQLVYSCDGVITLKDVVEMDHAAAALDTPVVSDSAANTYEGKSLRDVEREMMIYNLKRNKGYVKPSHETMKMSRATFYSRINEYGLKDLVRGYDPAE